MTGSISASGNITTTGGSISVPSGQNVNVPDQPTNSTHAANKSYVDSIAEGLHILEPCLVASFSNFSGTYTSSHNSSSEFTGTFTINFDT